VSAADNLVGSMHETPFEEDDGLHQSSFVLLNRRRASNGVWIATFNLSSKCRREEKHTKIGVCLRFASGQAVLMVIAKELVQEVNGFVRDIPLIFRSNEASPRFPLVPARQNMNHDEEVHPSIERLHSPSQDLIVLCIKLNIVFFKVCV
jgi:hypothetical protein